jgi:hypothetical protein
MTALDHRITSRKSLANTGPSTHDPKAARWGQVLHLA